MAANTWRATSAAEAHAVRRLWRSAEDRPPRGRRGWRQMPFSVGDGVGGARVRGARGVVAGRGGASHRLKRSSPLRAGWRRGRKRRRRTDHPRGDQGHRARRARRGPQAECGSRRRGPRRGQGRHRAAIRGRRMSDRRRASAPGCRRGAMEGWGAPAVNRARGERAGGAGDGPPSPAAAKPRGEDESPRRAVDPGLPQRHSGGATRSVSGAVAGPRRCPPRRRR